MADPRQTVQHFGDLGGAATRPSQKTSHVLMRTLKNVARRHAQRQAIGSAALAELCAVYLRCYRNQDYDMHRNGELFVLERLREFCPRVVFDVGAHRGEWTQAALDTLSTADVHAFEIAPETARTLEQRFAGNERVHVHAFGLDERSGETEFAYLGGDHSGSSLLTPQRVRDPASSQTQTAHTQTGDEFCRTQGIDRIDFLKVDAEGADIRVLRGFRQMFERGAIGLCQFEHNAKAIESHTMLVDFYDLLERHGYTLGKLWARGVSFGSYRHQEDNFRGPNFLAVHESRKELRARLHYEPAGFR